jgi:hypothetical protein
MLDEVSKEGERGEKKEQKKRSKRFIWDGLKGKHSGWA